MSQEKQLLIDLIQKHQKSSLTEQEKALLQDLVNKDEHNAEFFRINVEPSFPSSNVEEAYAKFQQIITKKAPSKETKVYHFSLWKYAVAASILLCGIFGIYHFTSPPSHEIVYEVPRGKRATYVLSDGSSVSLNGGSKLVIDEGFGEENRKVFLQGEGYFDVKHDAKNAFIVSSKNLKIKVLGTAFNVRDYEDDDIKETTLLRGKVELTYTNAKEQTNYTMLPGDKITFTKNIPSPQASTEPANLKIIRENIKEVKQLNNNIAWKDGVLIFDNVPLPLFVSKLEKWFNVNIEIKNKSLLDKRFTGSFSDLTIQEILRLIKETGGIKNVRKIDNSIIIE